MDDRLEATLRGQVAEEIGRWLTSEEEEGRPRPDTLDQQQKARAVLRRLLDEHAQAALGCGEAPLDPSVEEELIDSVLATAFTAAPALDRLLRRPDVTDVLINGCDDVRVMTLTGEAHRVEPFATTDDQLIEMIQTLARRGGHMEREWTPHRPILDLQLADGSRLAAAAWVTARPYIAVRRHAMVDADQRDLVRTGMYDEELRSLLAALVRSRRNLLISGGQGAGKTTLLRALLHECRADERIVVLEQEPELHLDRVGGRHDHVLVFMERQANAEGQGIVTLADLGRAVKRFTPERIVVGEVRGPEVIDMFEAMTQGIAGGLATIHAESSLGVFPRLPVYARSGGGQWSSQDVLELAAIALDAIVHLRRDRDGNRVVSEVRFVSCFDSVARQVVTDPWYVAGAGGRAVRNPSAPIPVDVLADLEDHGFRPSSPLVGVAG